MKIIDVVVSLPTDKSLAKTKLIYWSTGLTNPILSINRKMML